MKYWTPFILLLFFVVGRVASQDIPCPSLVQDVLTSVDTACADLGRNQACYGNIDTLALDHTGEPMPFEQVGDRVDIRDMASLTTFPMNLDDETWGVALLSLQANLPDTLPGQNVSFVVFGDVSLENEAEGESAPSITITATGSINVRTGPGTNFAVAGTLDSGAQLTAVGRTSAGDWLQVLFDGKSAWVYAPLVDTQGDVNSLLESAGELSYTAPMQAFRLQTGLNESPCEEAPRDGLLIQSPEGLTVNFLINGIEVTIGSTAVLRETDEETLRLINIEGNVGAAPSEDSVTLQPGQAVEVSAGDEPGEVSVYTQEDMRGLPLSLLPDQVSIAPVITSIQAYDVVGDGSSNRFPINFLNADGDPLVEVRQTLIAATSGNWFSGSFPVDESAYDDPFGGEFQYFFSCETTESVTVTYELVFVDAAGNASPPAQYTTTCTPP